MPDAADTPRRPNLVIFNPDQWRGDVLGCHGDPAAVTPNVDRMVETDAVSFQYTACQNPVCTPSRCSFMSGWYPHVRGHRGMHYMLRPPHDNNLLKTLKDAGYYVWWGGKNDFTPAQDSLEPYCHTRYSSHYGIVRDPTVRPPDPLYNERGIETFDSPSDFYSFYRGKLPHSEGVDYYRDFDWATVEGAIDFIRNYQWSHQPFCLFIAIAYPHPQYAVEDPWYSMIDPAKIPDRRPGPEAWTGPKPAFMHDYRDRVGIGDWDEDRFRELRRVYYGMVARVDHQIGMVLDALRDKGCYDDTGMFIFSDHGDWTGDYDLPEKHDICFDDTLVRVPMIVKPPASTPAMPGVRDVMAELIDFPATVEAWAGVQLDQPHFGRDLTPVITGERTEHRDAVFCEGGRLDIESSHLPHPPNRKLDPAWVYYPKSSVAEETLQGHGRAFMVRNATHKYVRRLYESDELYDLQADPMELHNLIEQSRTDPELGAIRQQLESRMLQWLTETSDIHPRVADKRD